MIAEMLLTWSHEYGFLTERSKLNSSNFTIKSLWYINLRNSVQNKSFINWILHDVYPPGLKLHFMYWVALNTSYELSYLLFSAQFTKLIICYIMNFANIHGFCGRSDIFLNKLLSILLPSFLFSDFCALLLKSILVTKSFFCKSES